MQDFRKQVWLRLGAALCLVAMAVGAARATIVDLDAYVLNPIYGGDGVTPLADGSWVIIVGSGDNVADPMQTHNGTNLIADSVTGDDVIIAIVQINSMFGPGTFGHVVQYDSSIINYVYIRFFEYTNWPISGMMYWGTSAVFQLGITLGVATVQFDPGGSLSATNYNSFVAIPEPSTANLLLLVGGMIWAMRASMKRRKVEQESEEKET
jgi:hypothetical protein